MQSFFSVVNSNSFRISRVPAAVAMALLSLSSIGQAATGPVTVKGVVAGSFFKPPVISDNPALATASATFPSVYKSAKVCFDSNDNAICDAGEISTLTKEDGSFLISSRSLAPLVAEISTNSTNNGQPITQRLVLRAAADQISSGFTSPLKPVNVAITPLSTEVARMMEDAHGNFFAEKQNLADRLGIPVDQVLLDPNKVSDPTVKTEILTESVILTNRFGLATKMFDRKDVSPTALSINANATSPAITMKEAEQASMNVEGIPRYDHIFIIMLENKGTNIIKGSPNAPKINGYMSSGNQFISYFATGNPSEPNYTALGGADDFGISDDSQWNCDATGSNAVQDLPLPDKNQPGLAKSPFATTCTQSSKINHNITGRANLFNALSSKGMAWRTYNESMNPGQDIRTDSVADPAVVAKDNIYPPGSLAGNTTSIGNPALNLPMPAGLYKTKHHPGMAYQNVRSAPEFRSSNRTMGGGQWDAALMNSSSYTIPEGYDIDQFGTDLQSGDIGNLNFVIPDQCDDMHSISVNGLIGTSGQKAAASDCNGSNIITRGDNYTDYLVRKIQSSPIWQNLNKRVAIVIMFDEGSATSGFNSCCGWNPGNSTVAKPLVKNADGTFSIDNSINNYSRGNRGHGESVFVVLNNQPHAPKGIVDSDAYSHFSFVRTLQDMFQLSDPGDDSSYMNRSKYTEKFIAANILNLPEYAGSADTHFDAVRPMNHAYVIPSDYKAKQSSDVSTPPQIGPDDNQINLWSLK